MRDSPSGYDPNFVGDGFLLPHLVPHGSDEGLSRREVIYALTSGAVYDETALSFRRLSACGGRFRVRRERPMVSLRPDNMLAIKEEEGIA